MYFTSLLESTILPFLYIWVKETSVTPKYIPAIINKLSSQNKRLYSNKLEVSKK